MKYSVVVMAAGKGSRMKSETPKVLHKICGKEMIYHILKEASKISDDITAVVYHQSQKVKKVIEDSFGTVSVVVQDHDNFPGTGGAIKASNPKNGKVLVLNGDMPLVTSEALKLFLNIEADVVISTFVLKDPSGYGRVVTANQSVEKIVEDKDASIEEKKINRVNAGVYLFNKSFLDEFLPLLSNNNAQREFYITELIELAIKGGRKVSFLDVSEEVFAGVNSKKELSLAEESMQKRIKSQLMENGVIMRLPDTIYIDSQAVFEGECEIESGCVIKGSSIIKNSVIHANSVIEDAYIENSSIGPLARVRPKTKLYDTHIGNFVEVKNSTLNGVKAGHLSYLGDAEIGSGTNIGAGTITCNYDGKNKYKTVIGKNVFIGSDTQLVAPVKIEDNSMIAAGTTVTSDVESGSLAISRTKQKNIAGFFAKFFK